MKSLHSYLKTISILTISLLSFKSNSQCVFPNAITTLDINNVSAKINNSGCLWTNEVGEAGYEFPKRTLQQMQLGVKAKTQLYGGGLWVSAIENGQLRIAVIRYPSKNSNDFSSGPINSTSNALDNNVCNIFNKLFVVYKSEIETHIDYLNTHTLPINKSNIPASVLNWPAKGNSNFTAYNIKESLAPFKDVNNNGIYDPENGDYPFIKGDQAIFCVLNDIGNIHTAVDGLPLGIEVHLMAYAFASKNTDLNNTTFYDYKVINKSGKDYSNLILSLFVDPDIGNSSDNYVGCDTILNSGFAYNSDFFTNIIPDYPSYVSTTFLNQKMNSFLYFKNSSGSQTSDPNTDVEFRNNMNGLNRFGIPFTIGKNGLNGTISTKLLFPGDPSITSEWSMKSANMSRVDYRYLQSTEEMTLLNNASTELNFMVNVYDNIVYKLEQKNSIRPKITTLLNLYKDSLSKGNLYNIKAYSAIQNHINSQLAVYPIPSQNSVTISSENKIIDCIEIYSLLGQKVISYKTPFQKTELNIENLQKGIYILKVYSGDFYETMKITKE